MCIIGNQICIKNSVVLLGSLIDEYLSIETLINKLMFTHTPQTVSHMSHEE